MTYEDKVIEAAREGLHQSNQELSKTLENLLRIVYRAGYKAAQLESKITQEKI